MQSIVHVPEHKSQRLIGLAVDGLLPPAVGLDALPFPMYARTLVKHSHHVSRG